MVIQFAALQDWLWNLSAEQAVPRSFTIYGNHFQYALYVTDTISLCNSSCLVFNHPRSEGWSLHGQVYSTSFCLSSSSIGLQTAFFHVVHPMHPWFPLFSCSRCSALHDFFSRQSPSFLITCPK